MEVKGKFGLLGRTLSHSYSKLIHEKFSLYSYDLFEVEPSCLEGFLSDEKICGFNVTIPYKTEIIKYLDYVDDGAKQIGAVNTVVRRDGKLYGYNTDIFGMQYMLDSAGIEVTDKVVAVLGSGGTSHTAAALLKGLGAKEILIVSRTGEINYQTIKNRQDVQVIINTTPVGMYPETQNSPIDLSGFVNLEAVADVVYNPQKTKLLYQAESLNIKCTGGLSMLVAQAKRALEIFTDVRFSDDIVRPVLAWLQGLSSNVVLIGMPGTGKTQIGKRLAPAIKRKFVDTDELIEKHFGQEIPTVFERFGEAEFRRVESMVLAEVGKKGGQVIATGGGIVENQDNHFLLKQNGTIVYIVRDLEKLSTKNRPLSRDLDHVKGIYERRKDKYAFFADLTIDNNGEINQTVKEIIKSL